MTNLDIYNHFLNNFGLPARVSALAARELLQHTLQRDSPNPINRFGNKIYSQNEEDGITFEILRRLGISQGVFAEFGVGNGFENNTLALMGAGWRGVWLGGEDIAFNQNPLEVSHPKFVFQKAWITPENAVSLLQESLGRIQKESADVISIDLDGNDLYIVRKLLEADFRPDLFILEYNSKFAPPIEFSVQPDPSHQWAGDDYMGVSLQSLVNELSGYDYALVCCNLSGCNAFFVRRSKLGHFSDVPRDVHVLYNPPRYHLSYMYTAGHPVSKRTVEEMVSRLV